MVGTDAPITRARIDASSTTWFTQATMSRIMCLFHAACLTCPVQPCGVKKMRHLRSSSCHVVDALDIKLLFFCERRCLGKRPAVFQKSISTVFPKRHDGLVGSHRSLNLLGRCKPTRTHLDSQGIILRPILRRAYHKQRLDILKLPKHLPPPAPLPTACLLAPPFVPPERNRFTFERSSDCKAIAATPDPTLPAICRSRPIG